MNAPMIAGPPAISPSSARRPSEGRFPGERSHDRKPLGRVVQRKAEDQEGAERQLSDRVCGPDREALAEVVKPDPDGDEQRKLEGTGSGLRGALMTPAQVAVEGDEREVGHGRPDEQELEPAERAACSRRRSRLPSR